MSAFFLSKQHWDDTLAEVSPEVSFKDMFNNVEVNIFTGEEL